MNEDLRKYEITPKINYFIDESNVIIESINKDESQIYNFENSILLEEIEKIKQSAEKIFNLIMQ